MIINHNISALNANNQLNKNDSKMAKSLERLTSGLKINSSADDAAGMAISQKMRSQIAGLDKASSNASDGISVIQTAEGALQEVESCLQRMRELSVQAANEINTLEDREAIQQEIDALNSEIQRISDTTEFNTKNLLDGSVNRKFYVDSSDISVISVSDKVDAGEYGITVTRDARQAVLIGKGMGTGATISQTITASQEGKVIVNGQSVEIKEGDSYSDVYEKIRTAAEDTGSLCYMKNSSNTIPDNSNSNLNSYAGYTPVSSTIASGKQLVFVSKGLGSDEEVSVSCDNEDLSNLLGLSPTMASATGVDARVVVNSSTGSDFSKTVTVTSDGDKVTITDFGDFKMELKINTGTVGTRFDDMNVSDAENGTTPAAPTAPTVTDPITNITTNVYQRSKISVLDAGALSLHIGANAYQTMDVTIQKVDPEVLGIEDIDVTTTKGAQKAISSVSDAITEVSSMRAKLGAYQNRLEHSIANLDTANENMTESLSRIEDADMAEEMTSYTQYNVLVQAGTSMLAQANERPQNILSLLQ